MLSVAKYLQRFNVAAAGLVVPDDRYWYLRLLGHRAGSPTFAAGGWALWRMQHDAQTIGHPGGRRLTAEASRPTLFH